MSRTRFLQDLLGSIFERRETLRKQADNRSAEDLCAALLSNRGEISAKQIGSALLGRFDSFDAEEKLAFFEHLNSDLDLDPSAVATAAAEYSNAHDAKTLSNLLLVAEPKRQELLRRLNQVPGATGQLVAMRAELLNHLAEHPELKRTDLDFKHLFGSWFNRGFLVMRHISWETPANILEKIIRYEAVHAIDDWDDLRARLEPPDRRCFAFFHPAMPDEPLVFVEVALASGTPVSIQDVLDPDRQSLEAESADTAVFYSISNCQAGLAGISFGNFLIKQVVDDLSSELPNLKTYVTLSPVPGFSRWCEENRVPVPDDPSEIQALAAFYIIAAKRNLSIPYDPVARFHLGNGARLEAVHTNADISDKGMRQSFGVMVNYLYRLEEVVQNHEDFAEDGIVAANQQVKLLAQRGENLISAATPSELPMTETN